MNISNSEYRITKLIEKGCHLFDRNILSSLEITSNNEELKTAIQNCLSKDDLGLQGLEGEYDELQEANQQRQQGGKRGRKKTLPRAK